MAPGHRRLLPEPGFAPREVKVVPRAAIPERRAREENPWFPSRLEKMGRSAYSNGSRVLSVTALGDAHRGARSWPSAAVSNHGEPAATTPRAAGSAVSGNASTMAAMVKKSFSRRRAATAQASSEPSRRSSRRSTCTAPPVYVRKQIVHNLHVVQDLEARGAVFVEDEREAPEGATLVLSAHGVAPSVHANSARSQSTRSTRRARS